MPESIADSTPISAPPNTAASVASANAPVPTTLHTSGRFDVDSTVNVQSGGGSFDMGKGHGPEDRSDTVPTASANASQNGTGTGSGARSIITNNTGVSGTIQSVHESGDAERENLMEVLVSYLATLTPEELGEFTEELKNGSVPPYTEGEDLDLDKILANAKMVSSTIKAGLASPVVSSPQLITSAPAIAGTSSNNGVSRDELKWLLPVVMCSGFTVILTLILGLRNFRRRRREGRVAREREVLIMPMNPLSAPAQPGDGGASIGSGNNVLQQPPPTYQP